MSKEKGAPEGLVWLNLRGLHDGVIDHVEVSGDTDDFSVVHADGSEHGLTVAASIKPHTLTFAATEDHAGNEPKRRYVHWLGKGESGKHEWTFRIYSDDSTEELKHRISFYVYKLDGGLGIGSYFREPIDAPNEWIHVVGVVDTFNQITRIYKNGVLKDVDNYQGAQGPLYNGDFENVRVETMTDVAGNPVVITPQHGNAPLRMGTRDLNSLFEGGLQGVRVWNRPLTSAEIAGVYAGQVPPNGLVAQYLLNTDTGTAAVDSVGAHDGTIIGASWHA